MRGVQIALGGGAALVLLLLFSRKARAADLPILRPKGKKPRNLEPHLDAVRAAAQEAGLSPLLLAAHALHESGGDAWAVRVEVEGVLESSARKALQKQATSDPNKFMDDLDAGRAVGARTASVGLMQILPSTAREVGFSGPSRDLFRPDVNLRFGALYLKKLLNRYPSDVRDAVASYNAGSAKYAAPAVAAVLIRVAAENKMSPCAFVAGSRSRVVQAAVAEAGGSFELAKGDEGARALRGQGKTVLCNREYVAGVLAAASALRAEFPGLHPMDTLPTVAGYRDGSRTRTRVRTRP